MNSKAIKFMSLSVLVLQTTVLVLVLRYSRTIPKSSDEPRYISSTVVVVSEVVKIITCVVILFVQHGFSVQKTFSEISNEILQKPTSTLKVSVPAILYSIQNNLLFFALSNLDAATYQVTYQLKILTTAVFSVFILHKNLGRHQWISLLLLTIGVALVQLPTGESAPKEERHEYAFLGFSAVVVACITSGFSGVYFEYVLKGSRVSLWIRNIQLAFFSIFFGFFAVYMNDFPKIAANGFFQGYDFITWVVILLQAYGGLIIALVVKYADNILKGFATSLSIILSSVASYFILGDFVPSFTFSIGAFVVIAATFLYSAALKPPSTPSKTFRT